MKIQFFCPLWGSENLKFAAFVEQVAAAGYDGVEMALPFEVNEKQEVIETLQKNNLQLIGQYWQSFERNLEEHAQNFEKYLRNYKTAFCAARKIAGNTCTKHNTRNS